MGQLTKVGRPILAEVTLLIAKLFAASTNDGQAWCDFGAKCCGFKVYAACGERPHAASALNA